VRAANLAQCVNVLQAVILTNKEKLVLTPTYHVMEMYNVHQGAIWLPLTVKTDDYVLGNERLPAVSASASRGQGQITHISLVNIDARQSRNVEIGLGGLHFKQVSGRVLTSGKLQDYNSFEEPQKIQPVAFHGAELQNGALMVKLPPFSVVVLELE
jgi:alpha-N-arabinofuranosidase